MYRKYYFIVLLFLATNVFSATITTFTGSANIEDAYIDETSTTTNRGTDTTLRCTQDFSDDNNSFAIRLFNIDDSIPTNATAIACTLKFTKIAVPNASLRWQRLCKPFTELGITWLDWVHPDSEWTTPGAMSDGGASCVDCYNNGDGTGSDISGVEYSFTAVGGANSVHALPIDTCIINAWISKSDSTNGLLFYINSLSINGVFKSSEAVVGYPEWVIVWNPFSEGGDGVPSAKHSGDGGGIKHSGDGASAKHGG